MTPVDSAAAPPAANQDAAGRFVRGNKAGLGNPFGRRSAELREMLQDELTDEQLQAVARAVIERAKKGDVAAARLTLLYAIGKPGVAVEPDRVDLDEYKLRVESIKGASEWAPQAGQISAEAANIFIDNVLPMRDAEMIDPLMAAFEAMNNAAPGEEQKAGRQAYRQERRRMKRRNSVLPPSTNGSDGREADDAILGFGKKPRDAAGPSWIG